MIHEGDMERGSGKPPHFDGSNYPYWKIRMSAHLQGIDWLVWEICEDATYVVLPVAARTTQDHKDRHNANSKARSVLFSSLSLSEFERVSDCTTAREIWVRLQSYHEGTAQVKTRLYETYKREYKNFSQFDGESIDAMFSRFQTIVNKMKANKANLPYSDHERALKLLYALDRKVWDVKVSAIIESANYDTLTVDELFSKLKSTEIDYQTQAKLKNPSAPTMALVSGSGSSSLTNPSQASFSLSCLMSVTEEQLESLGDDELALVISRFSRFHNNRLNRRRSGGPKEGCYGCGDPDHFVAHCPKKKPFINKYDSGKRKDKRDYTSGKHKAKGGFDKEAIKKAYRRKAKAQERAFLASLSDLDDDSDDDHSSSPSTDDESEKKREDKLNGLCFVAGANRGGFCTMAVDGGAKLKKDVDVDDDENEVPPTLDSLMLELDTMNDTLMSQDKLLKRAARERKEFKDQLEVALKELELAKSGVVVSEEEECDECAIHMSNLSDLQSKYAVLLDECDELKSRSGLLGACKSCSGLQSELAEKVAKLAEFEKANLDCITTTCVRCEALVLELESCRHDKMGTEEENTQLRSILSWVSCSEPQLGMMVSQFRRGTDSSGVGFAIGGKGEHVYGKVGEHSGLNPSEKPTNTPKLIKIPPPESTKPMIKDGVFEEPPKAPPSKQVWVPKPNHFRNSLDTLPNISSAPLPKAKKPQRVNHIHKRVSQPPSKREVRYHCDYCHRDGHLAEFCFRRKRDERREYELNNRNMYRPPHGVHVPPVQRHSVRPRGAMPQGARPQVARPRGGRARRGPSHDLYDSGPRDGGFQSHTPSGPRFPPRGDRFSPMGHGMYGVFPNTFPGQMTQHWYSPHFVNPSVVPFAHPLSFY